MATFFKGHEDLIARLDDLALLCERHQRPQATSFLDEHEWHIAQTYLQDHTVYRIDGGYEDAERKKVIFLPEAGDDFSDIVCLCASINPKFTKISHRDLLGSLMSLSIERSELGDIWVEDDKLVVYTSVRMAPFIQMNCTSVRRERVEFVVSEPLMHKANTEVMHRTVSSERFDNIVAAMANVSRSKAQQMIRDQLVQVDHETLEEGSKLCHNVCTVSIRRIGRFRYKGVVNTTKKDRMVIEFEKFI